MSRDDVAFDLMLLADLAPGREASARARRVDRDELAGLLAEIAPAVRVGGADLTFRDLRDFRPEKLAAALPGARGLAALRARLGQKPAPGAPELLAALAAIEPRTPSLEAMRSALGGGGAPEAAAPRPAPAAAPAAAGDGDLDAIFRMVETGTPSEAVTGTRAASHLDTLIAALGVTRRSPGAVGSAELARLAAALDDAMAGEIRSALHDPAFRRLEAAWLGLRFLVRRADFRSGLRVFVVPCDLAGLPEALAGPVRAQAEESQGEGRALCAIAALAAGPGDLGVVAEAATAAESLRVPLVLDADPALLGLDSLRALPPGERVADRLAEHAGGAWRELRERTASHWVALAVNRLLLRLPYGAGGERVRDFGFEEHPPGAEAHWAFGAASWLVAARLAEQAAASGWAVDVAGPHEAATGDLPVRPLALPSGETVNVPLEALLSEPRALELSEAGLLTLVCRRNHDAAWIPSAPTLSPAAGREEALRASLAHALWLSHLTALLSRLHGALDRDVPRADRVAGLARGLEFVAFGDDGPLLAVAADDSGTGPVTLTIRPLRPPLAGLPETTVEVPV